MEHALSILAALLLIITGIGLLFWAWHEDKENRK